MRISSIPLYCNRQNVSDFLPRLLSHSIGTFLFFLLFRARISTVANSGIYLRVYIALIHREIPRSTTTRRRYRYYYIGNNSDSRSFSLAHSISIQFSFSFLSLFLFFFLPLLSYFRFFFFSFGDSLSRGTTDNYSYLSLWNLTAYDLPFLDKDNSPRCTGILRIFSSGTKTEEVISIAWRNADKYVLVSFHFAKRSWAICSYVRNCVARRVFSRIR